MAQGLVQEAQDSLRARGTLLFALGLLAVCALLLFARLGHHALWDDEAVTALAAQAVWESGDTGAVVGHNVVGYGDGRLLRDLADRSTPPLPAYLAAPFAG